MPRRFIEASGGGALLGVALASLLLAGCASLGTRVVPAGEVEFELSGRIAVRYDHEASSGNFAWRHAASADEMLITSPLGQGIARIVRSGEAVTLTTSDERRYQASDAATLTEKVLGFRVPLKGLADWVRGRPEPGSPAQARYDGHGRLLELEQSGWRIEYLAYADDGALPSRLRLSYPGLELLLAIGKWQVAP